MPRSLFSRKPPSAIQLRRAWHRLGPRILFARAIMTMRSNPCCTPRPYPRRPARLSFSFSRQRQLASQAEEVIARFRRFAEQQPKNGRAQYYYAMSLWKGKRARDSSIDLAQIGALAAKSDRSRSIPRRSTPAIGQSPLRPTEILEAIPEYQRALELNSDLADAHYRLGQAYVHTGEKDQSSGTAFRSTKNCASSTWPTWTNSVPKSAIRLRRKRRPARTGVTRMWQQTLTSPTMHRTFTLTRISK